MESREVKQIPKVKTVEFDLKLIQVEDDDRKMCQPIKWVKKVKKNKMTESDQQRSSRRSSRPVHEAW